MVLIVDVFMHQSLHEWRYRDNRNADADRHPADGAVDIHDRSCRRAFGNLGAMAAGRLGDEAADIIAARGRQEPGSHHQADHARRRELGHRRQAHRRQAELAHRVQEIDEEDEEDRGQRGTARGRAGDEDEEARTQQDDADAELRRRRRFPAPLVEPQPQAREDRSQKHDIDRVDRLEDRGRDVHAEEGPIDLFVGIDVERRTRLLEQRPEERLQSDEEQGREDAVAVDLVQLRHRFPQEIGDDDGTAGGKQSADHTLVLNQHPDDGDADDAPEIDGIFHRNSHHGFGQHRRIAGFAAAAKRRTPPDEDDEAEQHADAGGAEAPGPAIGLAEIAGDRGTGRRADVDAHVEDGEGRIAARVALAVKLTDDGGDVGLQEADAHDDEGERQPEDVEHRRILSAGPLERHQAVADGEEDGAELHRLSLPDITVGEIAADHRRDVDQRRVSAVDDVSLLLGKQPMLHQIEDQEGAHPVIGEALPHLGEEQDEKAAGMTQKGLAAYGSVDCIGGHGIATPTGERPLSMGAASLERQTNAINAHVKPIVAEPSRC